MSVANVIDYIATDESRQKIPWVRLTDPQGVVKIFRVPTFTELYYHDPNHQASPDLRPESAWGGDAALDLELSAGTSLGVTAFHVEEDAGPYKVWLFDDESVLA